jgi:hypothetical protein
MLMLCNCMSRHSLSSALQGARRGTHFEIEESGWVLRDRWVWGALQIHGVTGGGRGRS